MDLSDLLQRLSETSGCGTSMVTLLISRGGNLNCTVDKLNLESTKADRIKSRL